MGEANIVPPIIVKLKTGATSIGVQQYSMSLETQFNLQTGDVKGSKSSTSGRNVEWSRCRELVLYTGKLGRLLGRSTTLTFLLLRFLVSLANSTR